MVEKFHDPAAALMHNQIKKIMNQIASCDKELQKEMPQIRHQL